MPSGVYIRKPSAARDAAMRRNLAKGRSRVVRDKVNSILRENAKNEEWRQMVSARTKAALWSTDIRDRYLRSMEEFYQRPFTDYVESPIPISDEIRDDFGDEFIGRFWSRVLIGTPDECWPFIDADSYQFFRVGGGRDILSNRIVAAFVKGEQLEGEEQSLHKCANPVCCNPSHIYVGTNLQNQKDRRRDVKIRRFYGNGAWSIEELCEEFTLTPGCIRSIINHG